MIKNTNAGYGSKAHQSLAELDDVQTLSEHPLAIDAAYFNGYNKDGYYLGAGIQRRPKGRIESLLFVRVPGIGILEWPHSPSTATTELRPNSYSAIGGLELTMVEPMKRWKIKFDGDLSSRKTKTSYHVKFDLDFVATSDYFDFDTDMDPHAISSAVALEPWSKEFFDRLASVHQTHHEQFGVLQGNLHINDKLQQISLKSMRDHSYGMYRNWNDFHRYILQYFAFDDGSHMALHLVSLSGSTMSHLVTGFVIERDGTKSPIYSCNTHLYDIAEDGQPPDAYSLGVIAGGKSYELKVTKTDSAVYYCGWNWEAKLHSYMCKASVNGINGFGMCEFEYRNINGKIATND